MKSRFANTKRVKQSNLCSTLKLDRNDLLMVRGGTNGNENDGIILK
ncbi:MAG: hypothetical protein JXA77_07200 [Bacteroidales bacterium]|nr:hypothetical protein [Bacteroidales bacterium]MBN2819662.1 hypothetical protein [Bacteroidales bacterium]